MFEAKSFLLISPINWAILSTFNIYTFDFYTLPSFRKLQHKHNVEVNQIVVQHGVFLIVSHMVSQQSPLKFRPLLKHTFFKSDSILDVTKLKALKLLGKNQKRPFVLIRRNNSVISVLIGIGKRECFLNLCCRIYREFRIHFALLIPYKIFIS